MKILCALLLSLAFIGSSQAVETTKWSHYDSVTLGMSFLGSYHICKDYQLNLLVTETGEYYHCYLVRYKHRTFNIICEVDFDLASKCFPSIEHLKDFYNGPKDSESYLSK